VIKVEFAPDKQELDASLDRFLGQRIEGLFCLNFHCSPAEAKTFRENIEKYRIPLICSDSTAELSDSKVSPDDEGATRLALEHLIKLGHQRIAFIGGGTSSEGGVKRKDAYVNILEEHSIPLDANHLQLCDWDIKSTEDASERLLADRAKAPMAIICASDVMALAVLRRARKMGYSIPKDLSVIGYSNEVMTELADPPLTVLDMHHGEVGRVALQQLLDIAEISAPEKRLLQPHTTLIKADLIVRESTATPRAD